MKSKKKDHPVASVLVMLTVLAAIGTAVWAGITYWDVIRAGVEELWSKIASFFHNPFGAKRWHWFGPLRTRWNMEHLLPQRARLIADLARFGLKKHAAKKTSRRASYLYKGNIFERFDSFAGRSYFLYDIEKHGYEIIPSKREVLNPASIRNYLSDHPLAKPDATKRVTAADTKKPEKAKYQTSYKK